MKRIHRWLLVALVFAVAASAAFADTSDQEASGPFVGPRLSTRKRVSAMLAHHQKAKSQHLSAARHKFRSTAAAEAEAEAKDEGEGGGKVIVLDIAPGIIGIANTGQPPAPIPTGESVFGNLRAKQVYPSYPTNNPADKQFTGDKEQSFLEADMYSLASSEEGEEGGAEAAKPDPRPKSGWPRIGQLHMDDVEPAKGSWRVTNAVMHLGPQGHRLDILPESNPFEPLRALVEAEATASEGGEPTTKVADLPPQHPSSLYAGLPPAPPSSAPNPFGPLEVFLESDSPRTRRRNYMSRFRATSERTTHETTAGEAGDLQVIKVADIPPQHPSSINTGLPPPPPTKFPNPFGSLEVFLERRSASSSLETPGTGMGRFAARARPGAEPVEFAGGVRVRNPPPKPKKDGGKAKGKGNGKGKAGGKGKGKADAKAKGKGKADAKGKGKADAKNKPKAKPKGSRRSQAALERAVAGMGEGAEKSDEPAESGQKIIFDFPPGYFGFGGYGEKFESKPIFEHPQNPLNLNPYGGLEPKAGVLEEGDWKPPEGVGKNPFGPLRT